MLADVVAFGEKLYGYYNTYYSHLQISCPYRL